MFDSICTLIFGLVFVFILVGLMGMPFVPGKAKIVLLAMAIVVFVILLFMFVL